eukprot:c18300_g2_i1 orf=222-800(-)
MGEQCHHKKEKQQRACILCTLLLVGILILLLILYFTVFKPKDPRVQVPTMQLLSYTAQGGSASLSLNLQVSMYNPNRGDFIIEEGSTACLYYQNQQVGFTPIPTGTIPSQSFSSSTISLSSSSVIQLQDYYAGSASVLPVTTSVTLIGHVTTANLFSHHSDVVSKCKVALSLSPPRSYIQSYTCQRSYSLDD